MCSIVKGIYKGVKYVSQILVVKERDLEMEIGYPTDVKHVAHIGADGIGGATPPSWMNGFRNGPDFSANSRGSFKEKKTSSPNGGVKQSTTGKVESATDQKKHRRKKSKSSVSSSPANSGTSGSKVKTDATDLGS